jgi:hypothetical protein
MIQMLIIKGEPHFLRSQKEAERARFVPLTIPIELPEEKHIAESLIAGLEQSKIPWMIVGDHEAIEVWRTRRGMILPRGVQQS